MFFQMRKKNLYCNFPLNFVHAFQVIVLFLQLFCHVLHRFQRHYSRGLLCMHFILLLNINYCNSSGNPKLNSLVFFGSFLISWLLYRLTSCVFLKNTFRRVVCKKPNKKAAGKACEGWKKSWIFQIAVAIKGGMTLRNRRNGMQNELRNEKLHPVQCK